MKTILRLSICVSTLVCGLALQQVAASRAVATAVTGKVAGTTWTAVECIKETKCLSFRFDTDTETYFYVDERDAFKSMGTYRETANKVKMIDVSATDNAYREGTISGEEMSIRYYNPDGTPYDRVVDLFRRTGPRPD